MSTTYNKMKRNKLGILAVLALGGLMACGPIARADDKPTPPAAGTDAPAATPRPPRGRGLQPILDKLDLTADQKEKVKPILADVREKMSGLRDLSQEDRQAKMKEVMTDADAKLKEILTADQFTKYQELRKQMGRNRGPGGPAPAAPATPPDTK
jgi:periplasmic protein CpxP/Spy